MSHLWSSLSHLVFGFCCQHENPVYKEVYLAEKSKIGKPHLECCFLLLSLASTQCGIRMSSACVVVWVTLLLTSEENALTDPEPLSENSVLLIGEKGLHTWTGQAVLSHSPCAYVVFVNFLIFWSYFNYNTWDIYSFRIHSFSVLV